MAWAPPMANTLSTRAIAAAARTTGAIDPSGWGGVVEDNFPDAGDSGGDGGHEHSGRIDCGAAGHVETRTLDSRDPLPEPVAPEVPDGVSGKLGLVGLNALGGEFEGVGDFGRD